MWSGCGVKLWGGVWSGYGVEYGQAVGWSVVKPWSRVWSGREVE